ncbi:MAG: lamin tail domain-containing protein [Myxococcota bacterium]
MRRLAPLLLLALGCVDETAILVSVDGSQLPAGTVDTLRITATGADTGEMASFEAPVDGTWPQTLAVRPANSSSELVAVTVVGLLGVEERIRSELTSQFADGRTVTLVVSLEAACVGVMCPPGSSCRAGSCGGIQPDMGVEMGVDMRVAEVGMDADMAMDEVGPDAADMGVDMEPETGMDAEPEMGPDMAIEEVGPDLPPLTGSLIISEYVEGSGFNKAIELFNASGDTVDLGDCTLTLRITCGSGASTSHTLSGSLAPGETYVICNSRIASPGACDDSPSVQVINHNGNDGFELSCGGSLVDSFGGELSSGACENYEGGGVSAADQTLRRRATIVEGDTNFGDAFDPSAEWEQFDRDELGGLGSHTVSR